MKTQILIISMLFIFASINTPKQKKVKKEFTLEMANGEIYQGVSETLLVKSFNSLNDDNFFLTLTKGDDFLQVAYSENGFEVQYKKDGIQYEATKAVEKQITLELLKKYFNEDAKWNASIEWEIMK